MTPYTSPMIIAPDQLERGSIILYSQSPISDRKVNQGDSWTRSVIYLKDSHLHLRSASGEVPLLTLSVSSAIKIFGGRRVLLVFWGRYGINYERLRRGMATRS